jgi:hypothetical protein
MTRAEGDAVPEGRAGALEGVDEAMHSDGGTAVA